MEKQLRTLIKEILHAVTEDNAPMVHKMIQSENGYKTIEDKMIVMAIKEDISLSATIPHIENML